MSLSFPLGILTFVAIEAMAVFMFRLFVDEHYFWFAITCIIEVSLLYQFVKLFLEKTDSE